MCASQRERGPTNLLVTGPPGVGKTTIVLELAELLADRVVAGFHTQEIRRGGRREGFRAETLTGESCVLAHVKHRSQHRVGRHGVDVVAFEALVLPELARVCDVLLIDEIGKMECFSPKFVAAVRRRLDERTSVVATVALKGGGFIAEVKGRPDVQVWHATRANRDELPERLAETLADPPAAGGGPVPSSSVK